MNNQIAEIAKSLISGSKEPFLNVFIKLKSDKLFPRNLR